MQVDIDQIPYADIKRNSLLVVRLPDGTQNDLSTVNALADGLRGHIDPTTAFIVVRSNVDIAHLPEEVMNQAGWYRRNQTNL